MAFEHPQIVVADYFHYASDLPLRSLERLLVWEPLTALITVPPAEIALIEDSLGTRVQLQSLDGNNNELSIDSSVDATGLVVFDFEAIPVLLPQVLNTSQYLTFVLRTRDYVASVTLAENGIAAGGATTPSIVVEEGELYVSGKRRYRLQIDNATGATSFYVDAAGTWTLLAEWTADNVMLSSGCSVVAKGSLTSPVSVDLYSLRMTNVVGAPADPTAVVTGDENTSTGILTTLSGVDSIDPGGGAPDYVWFLDAPEDSETEITEESASSVILTTPGGDTITFSLPGMGIDGDLYILEIVDGTLSITLDDKHITLQYPFGSAVEVLQTALILSTDENYNPAVSAILEMESVGTANDLPNVAAVYRFDGGRSSTANSVVITPDQTGIYVVGLGVRAANGLWDVEIFGLSASPHNVVFGSAPDVGFIRNQVSGWWKGISDRDQIEAAWGAAGQLAASDLLDILQTRMTRVFNRIPELWRKRWYDLKMRYEFAAVPDVVATQHTEYALRGVAVPVDDYDDDATGMSMTPASVNFVAPVTVEGLGSSRYIAIPDHTAWKELGNVAIGSLITVGGSTYQVTDIDGSVLTGMLTDGVGAVGNYTNFDVVAVASGNVSSREYDFLALITQSELTTLGCAQDIIPARTIVDTGNAYGYVHALGPPDEIRLRHGFFSDDAQAGDWMIINGVPRLIASVTPHAVTLTALPIDTPAYPVGTFSWEIWRPVPYVTWEALGYVELTELDETFSVGDMALLHARGLGQVDAVYATIRHIDEALQRYYFSLNDLYFGLSLTRSAWGELDLSCSAILRTNYVPVPDTAHFVPVIRTTLLVDSPALILNEDYQIVNGQVVLDTPYSIDSAPPPSLWAENMLLYNWYASETWGELTGITIDEITDPEVYVPLVRSVYDQRMHGPWKFMMERAAAAIIGLPFAIEEGEVPEVGDGWVGVQGLDRLRMYHTDYPPDLRIYDPDTDSYLDERFVVEFQALDTRLKIVDRVDADVLFDTYKTAEMLAGNADWWHDFIVSVSHTAAPGAPWSTLFEYVRDSKPVWTDFMTVVRFDFEENVQVDDALTLNVKHYFFDVPTACVYPDSPLVKGCAHMFDDPVWGHDGVDFTFTADGGSNTTVTEAGRDFPAAGVRRGCVVFNITQQAYGWVTHVEVGTIHVEYGMKDETGNDNIVNVNTDEIRVQDGGFRLGMPFDTPLRGVAGPLTNANQIEFIPFAGSVDYTDSPVVKDLAFYGVERGWTIRNRTVGPPSVEDTVRSVAGDVATLTAGVIGQAPGDIIEWEPPTGVGAHIFGDPEIRGPMAHPYLRVAEFDTVIPGGYSFPAVPPPWLTTNPLKLFDETRPDPPFEYGVTTNIMPVIRRVNVVPDPPDPSLRMIGPVGTPIEIHGGYFAGIIGVTVGGAALVGWVPPPPGPPYVDSLISGAIPALPPGLHDIVLLDGIVGPVIYGYQFEVI